MFRNLISLAPKKSAASLAALACLDLKAAAPAATKKKSKSPSPSPKKVVQAKAKTTKKAAAAPSKKARSPSPKKTMKKAQTAKPAAKAASKKAKPAKPAKSVKKAAGKKDKGVASIVAAFNADSAFEALPQEVVTPYTASEGEKISAFGQKFEVVDTSADAPIEPQQEQVATTIEAEVEAAAPACLAEVAPAVDIDEYIEEPTAAEEMEAVAAANEDDITAAIDGFMAYQEEHESEAMANMMCEMAAEAETEEASALEIAPAQPLLLSAPHDEMNLPTELSTMMLSAEIPPTTAVSEVELFDMAGAITAAPAPAAAKQPEEVPAPVVESTHATDSASSLPW